ncbi:MAG TPA: hypothetical protein VJK29_13540, partial [Terriglobales bacterium]|nr:hypothetical protein [Terriglobales bacterium]
LQAPSIIMAPNANTSVIHFNFCCFTFSSLHKRAHLPVARGSSPGGPGQLLRLAPGLNGIRNTNP